MRFTVTSTELKAALSEIAPAISNRAILPVLHMLYVKVEQNSITLTGSSIDLFISKKINAITSSTGCVLIPFKEVKNLAQIEVDQLEFYIKGKSLWVASGADQISLGVLSDPKDFPVIKFNKINDISLSRDILRSISAASIGVSSNTMSAEGSVLLRIAVDMIYIVSTDMRNVYVNNTSMNGLSQVGDVLIPTSVVSIIAKQNMVALSFDDKTCCLSFDDTTIYFTKNDVKFLNYESVLRHHETNISIPMRDFDRAIDKILSISPHNWTSIITMNITDGEIQLYSDFHDIGMSANCILSGTITSPPVDLVKISGNDMKRVLRQLAISNPDAQTVNIGFVNARTPMSIRADGFDSVTILSQLCA